MGRYAELRARAAEFVAEWAQWGAVLHDPDLSAAILDRLLHRGEILKLAGRSYRQHRPGQLPAGAAERATSSAWRSRRVPATPWGT